VTATDDSVEAGSVNGDRGSNVTAVYERLKEAILNHDLPAGARLSQPQLAAQFDMSRAPLREALRLLERDGLIETQHRRMVHVSSMSSTDLDQLYALRIVNEALAVRLAVPSMSDDDIGALETSLVELARCAERGDWSSWDVEHRQFHLRLYAGAGDRILRMIGELFDHGQRYRAAYRTEEPRAGSLAATEHAHIVRACRDRDSVKASELIARHLARTALTLFAHAAPEHEPALVRDAVRFVTQGPTTGSEPTEPSPTGGR
jgi:DNA-binding GntR family transcriptional regulator